VPDIPTTLEQLRALPRDGALITELAVEAIAAHKEWPGTIIYLGPEPVPEGIHQFPDVATLKQHWSEIMYRHPAAVAVCCDATQQHIRMLMQQLSVNNNTAHKRARRWAEHILHNIPVLCENPSVLALEGAYNRVPAFLVGAGPSLGKTQEQAAQAREYGIVISVNAATRCVEGQVALTIESHDLTGKWAPGGSINAGCIQAHPATFAAGTGPSMPMLVGEIAGAIEELVGYRRLPTSGNGTTAAFALAHRMGCDPIILIGQDLAFTDGQIYSEGAFEGGSVRAEGEYLRFDWSDTAKALPRPDNPLPEQEEAVMVQGWDGKQVATNLTMHSVNEWLAGAARRADRTCINATGQGAVVPYWQPIYLDTVYRQLPKRRITEKLMYETALAKRKPLSPEVLGMWANQQKIRLGIVAARARRLAGLCKKGLGQSKAIDLAEAALLRAVGACSLLEPWAHRPIANIMQDRRKDAPYRNRRREAQKALQDETLVAELTEEEALDLAHRLEEVRG
jgi:hypothetical protein